MSSLPPLSALMRAIGFTREDLNLNRSRQMSDAQRARLRGMQQRTLLLGAAVFLLLAFAAALLIYLGQRDQQLLLSALGMFATVINAISVGFSARAYFRLAADLRAAEPVDIHEGILQRVVRPNGQVNNLVLRLAGRDFNVTREVFRQFRHEQVYSIYATQHSNIILSAECLSDPDAELYV